MKINSGTILALDNSTLSDWCHCPRRYWWRHELGITPGFPSISLGFGLAFHEAMDVAYRWLAQHPGEAWTPDITAKARVAAREAYARHVPPDAALTEELRTAGKLDTLLTKYFSTYPREPFTVLDVEMSFALAVTQGGYAGAITNATPTGIQAWAAEVQRDRPSQDGILVDDPLMLLWLGRMDLVVDWSGIRTIDHKTTAVMGLNWAKQWAPNTQMSGYLATLEQLFDHHRVTGAVINGVQVAKTMHGMTRHPTTRRPDEMRAFHKSITAWAQAISTDTTFPMNTTSCTAYGECPYRDLCNRYPLAPDMDRRLLLASLGDDYRVETWNPLEKTTAGGAE